MVRIFIVLQCLIGLQTVKAQLPATDIYITTLIKMNNKLTTGKIQYLSSFNPDGYNNQAQFFNNGWIYITSDYRDSAFTDIIALNIDKKEFFKVTDTQGISEFSPTPIPNSNEFCTVRIERDGKDQSLWEYPLSREHAGKRLFPALKNIGYFCWLNPTNVAMFLVGDPHQLVIGNTSTEKIQTIATNPGRCLKTDHKSKLYFVEKILSDIWLLKSYNPTENTTQAIIKMPTGKEDFTLLPDGTFISALAGKILAFHPDKDSGWQMIADLSDADINNIQRPVYHNGQLLFINGK